MRRIQATSRACANCRSTIYGRSAAAAASLSGMRRVLLIVVALVLLAFAGAGVVRGLQYRGAAKPGVHVLGTDVGGKSRAQIEAAVQAWGNRLVTVRAGGRSYR